MWPMLKRQDSPPDGLIAAGHADILKILDRMEAKLSGRDFLCGELSIAEFALFPHVSALKFLGVTFDRQSHPGVLAWFLRVKALPAVQQDLDNLKAFMSRDFSAGPRHAAHPYESRQIVWRGDRLEWLFLHGFQDWWMEEQKAGRATIPAAI
jgi:hypothetical protein